MSAEASLGLVLFHLPLKTKGWYKAKVILRVTREEKVGIWGNQALWKKE